MQIPKLISKYLRKQELGKWNLELDNNRLYDNIIVIPAFNESENIPSLLNSLSQNSVIHLSDTLIVVVVNNISDTSDKVKSDNIKLLDSLDKRLRNENPLLNIGYIDAVSKGNELPKKNGGVGFARKIGLDLALKQLDFDNEKKKLLICLDADCIVTPNYLEEIVDQFERYNFHAATIDYEHISPKDPTQEAAIIKYEIFLRYYVLGLKYSDSRYAHHSIGSIIICDAESYVKVGGMNKRKAGEDFYFLEKLAKISKIGSIKNAKVFPSARISDRVPFGTGKKIQQFLNQDYDEYTLYSPKSFQILKKWIELFHNKFKFSNSTDSNFTLRELLSEARKIDSCLYDYLNEQNFKNDFLNIINNSKSYEQLQKQKINWLDGFRTLKLIHYLRDHKFPNENMFKAINHLVKMMNHGVNFNVNEHIPPTENQLKYLKLLRELT